MVEQPHIKYILPDRSYQGLVRSELRKLAETAGFTGHRLGEVEIIIAEMTSNLIKHATKGGYILARLVALPSPGVEFISIDAGPGMRSAIKMIEDGQSTTNTLGQGLGAIQRLSSTFDIYSIPGWGTILYSRIYISKTFVEPVKGLQVAALSVCKKGEVVCGDGWVADMLGRTQRLVMIDGLGHGPAAHEAVVAAEEALKDSPAASPMDQLRTLHPRLKKTRGAVVTVAYIDEVNQQLKYSGVGNIGMKHISVSRSHGCLSYNGIVGHIMPGVMTDHVLQIDKRTDIFVMHSDGLSSRWDLQKYPGILQHHGMMICGALYKDFDRGTDDTTVLAAKFTK